MADRREPDALPLGQDLHPHDVAVALPGLGLELGLALQPAHRPIADRDPRHRRVDPFAAVLGALDRHQPALGVNLAIEVPCALSSGRVAIPSPPTTVLTLMDIAHVRPPTPPANASPHAGRSAGGCRPCKAVALFRCSATGKAFRPGQPRTPTPPGPSTTAPASGLLLLLFSPLLLGSLLDGGHRPTRSDPRSCG